MPTRLILDVDTGTDDAVALMLAALHPELDLVAATTVNGNVPVELCTQNSLSVLDYIGARVPVYEGASRPLARPDFPIPRASRGAISIHGERLEIPPGHSSKQSPRALEFLIETYMSSAGEDVVLMPTGPLTNIAMAMVLEPRIVRRIPEIILMGGGHEIGNVTPAAEFNIWADPEAARVVLSSGHPRLTMVPLDATHRVLMSIDDCRRMRGLGTPAGEAAAIFIERRIRGYEETQPIDQAESAPVHDALCVAALVDRSVITTQPYYVDVETHGELTVGRTVVDTHHRSGREPTAAVAVDGDRRRFLEILFAAFGRRRQSSA